MLCKVQHSDYGLGMMLCYIHTKLEFWGCAMGRLQKATRCKWTSNDYFAILLTDKQVNMHKHRQKSYLICSATGYNYSFRSLQMGTKHCSPLLTYTNKEIIAYRLASPYFLQMIKTLKVLDFFCG